MSRPGTVPTPLWVDGRVDLAPDTSAVALWVGRCEPEPGLETPSPVGHADGRQTVGTPDGRRDLGARLRATSEARRAPVRAALFSVFPRDTRSDPAGGNGPAAPPPDPSPDQA